MNIVMITPAPPRSRAGNRATAAEKVGELLDVGGEWLRERVGAAVLAEGGPDRALDRELDAFKLLLRVAHQRHDNAITLSNVPQLGLLKVGVHSERVTIDNGHKRLADGRVAAHVDRQVADKSVAGGDDPGVPQVKLCLGEADFSRPHSYVPVARSPQRGLGLIQRRLG